MAQQKFQLKIGGSKNTSTAADELRKIEAKKEFNFQVIPYDKIIPNPKNNYPIKDIEELAESIDKNGLIHILKCKATEDGTFLLISGERRYRAIGLILEQGEPKYKNSQKFKHGIPCMVEELGEVDEEIQLIIANEEVREKDPVLSRQNIKRLNELYERKYKDSEEKISLTKVIAKDLKIGERQVQRYNAVNQKLIPELLKAFDESKINLEKAAQFANLDESTQLMIVELLELNKNINKDEIEIIKKAAEEKEKELTKKISDLSYDIENSNKQNEVLIHKLNDKESEILATKEKEEALRIEIENELKASQPNQEKISELQELVEQLKQEAYENECEKEDINKQLDQRQKDLNKLRKELEAAQKDNNKNQKLSLTTEEKAKLKDSFEITNIVSEIKKSLNQLYVKSESFKKSYNESISLEYYKEIIEKAIAEKERLE